jgi:hypothetical protein
MSSTQLIKVKLWVHNDDFSSQEVVVRKDLVPNLAPGDVLELMQPTTTPHQDNHYFPPHVHANAAFIQHHDKPRYALFVYEESDQELLKRSTGVQISISSQMASALGLRSHADAFLQRVLPQTLFNVW